MLRNYKSARIISWSKDGWKSKNATQEQITQLNATGPRVPSYDPVAEPDNSIDAVETAISIASASSGIKEIHCLHVYNVPIGFYKTGKSYEEFAEIMKGHAEKNYREFMKKIDLKGLSANPILRLEKKEYKGIYEVVKEYQISLLVVGARGRKAGAGVLLGSVTEHLINTTTVPLIAVKKKGTGLGLLEALLKL